MVSSISIYNYELFSFKYLFNIAQSAWAVEYTDCTSSEG